MRQAGVCACLIIRVLFSVVELQRQLDIPWRLGTGNLSHVSANTRAGHVQLYVVKRIDEVRSELQPEPLCHLEVLLQTQVNVGVMRRSQPS